MNVDMGAVQLEEDLVPLEPTFSPSQSAEAPLHPRTQEERGHVGEDELQDSNAIDEMKTILKHVLIKV